MSKMLHEVKPEYQHEAPQKTGRDDVAVGVELAEAAASSAEAVAMILSVADQKRFDVMKAANEPPVRVEDFDTEIANMAKDLSPFTKVDGWQWCLVCHKWSNGEHVESAAHQSAMATQAGLQLFCGRPTMNDGFAIYAHGCVPEPGAKEISWDRLKAYWGDHLIKIHRVAGQKFHKTGVAIKYNDRKPAEEIPGKAIAGLSGAVISYRAGDGKYRARSGHKMVLFDQLPHPSDVDTEWWPIALLSLLKPYAQKFERYLEEAEQNAEHMDVTAVSTATSVQNAPLVAHDTATYCVCVYKLLWPKPVAWPVRLRVRDAM